MWEEREPSTMMRDQNQRNLYWTFFLMFIFLSFREGFMEVSRENHGSFM